MNLVMALVPAAALAAGNYLVAVQPGCIACTAWLVAGPFVLALLLVAVLPRIPAGETVAPVVAAPPAATAEDGALGLLAALQATDRLVDFLEEDLAPNGVDLGTTNTECAWIDTRAGRTIRIFDVTQVLAPGETAPRPTLPSFVYLAGPHDLPPQSLDLPWAAGRDFCVGLLAREQGGRVPGRLVASAKSWLCHGGVDRTAAILPWGAAEGVPRISPVDASARILRHL